MVIFIINQRYTNLLKFLSTFLLILLKSYNMKLKKIF